MTTLKLPTLRLPEIRKARISYPWRNLVTDQVIENLCLKGESIAYKRIAEKPFVLEHEKLVNYAFTIRPLGGEVAALLAFVEARCPLTGVWHYDDSEFSPREASKKAVEIAKANNKNYIVTVRHHVTRPDYPSHELMVAQTQQEVAAAVAA